MTRLDISEVIKARDIEEKEDLQNELRMKEMDIEDLKKELARINREKDNFLIQITKAKQRVIIDSSYSTEYKNAYLDALRMVYSSIHW